MAKSLRSKIKRKFRTELRKRVGVPHQEQMEQKIQDNLKKAIESQVGGKSMMELKQLMGGASAPVATRNDVSMIVDDSNTPSVAQTEAELLNDEAVKADKKVKVTKKPATKRRKNKFMHFHTLRKKGV